MGDAFQRAEGDDACEPFDGMKTAEQQVDVLGRRRLNTGCDQHLLGSIQVFGNFVGELGDQGGIRAHGLLLWGSVWTIASSSSR